MSLFPPEIELVDGGARVRFRDAVEERRLHVRHLLLDELARFVVLESPARVAGRPDVHEADLDRLPSARLSTRLRSGFAGAIFTCVVVSAAAGGDDGEKERGADRRERAKHECLLG